MFHVNPPLILLEDKQLCWTVTFKYVDPVVMCHYRYLETYEINIRGFWSPNSEISFLRVINKHLYKMGKCSSRGVEEVV